MPKIIIVFFLKKLLKDFYVYIHYSCIFLYDIELRANMLFLPDYISNLRSYPESYVWVSSYPDYTQQSYYY